jgi:hypothetical protein
MPVRVADISTILVERIEACHPAPALFSAAETNEWPTGVLEHLLTCGVLLRAARAQTMLCPGCEWQCHKPVVVRTVRTAPRTQAFIACDEEPDHGRISVPLPSLNQYSATLASLSGFFAGLMGRARGPPQSSPSGASFLLGSTKGRHGLRQVSVGLDAGRLLLRVGQQQESVVRILRWNAARLSIDAAHIRRLANRKGAAQRSRTDYTPDRTRQKERSCQTWTRNKRILLEAKKRRAAGGGSWTAIANAIAATKLARTGNRRQTSAATVRRIITEMLRRERENTRSNRKNRR